MSNTKTPESEKDLNYWNKNAEEEFAKTPISVLRYISELEIAVKQNRELVEALKECIKDQEELHRVFSNWAKTSTGDKSEFYNKMALIASDRIEKNKSLIQKSEGK